VLRTLTIIALIAALMQPVWTASMRQVSVVYALDVSRSVASGFVHSAMQFIEKANREAAPAEARYVVFADGARTAASSQSLAQIGLTAASSADPHLLNQGATNLETALDEALPSRPSIRHTNPRLARNCSDGRRSSRSRL
jgi:hypothetical protein